MNITGIVVEYNPFHKGHLYHINKTREITNCEGVIAVMSGNFVQRGVPAVVDKWNRAKTALMNGVDLVIELPMIYSLSSAEFFAHGSISLLNNLGVTNSVCFGSEEGSAGTLFHIAKILSEEPPQFKQLLRKNLDCGLGYALSRSKALIEFLQIFDNKELLNLNTEKVLSSSNNILGIEYCKSLIRLKSEIQPFSIKREGGTYTSTSLNDKFSSASSIRKFIKDTKSVEGIKNHLPKNVFDLFLSLYKNNYNFVFEDSILPYLKYKAITHKNLIENLPDVSEGIHNRILRSLDGAKSHDGLINLIKTKRYTYTRISRILCQFFIGFENFNTSDLRTNSCPYARILGFNSIGLKILKEAKRKSSIPIYTKLPKCLNDVLSLDILGTKMYSLLNNNVHPNSDYLISPIMMI